MVKYSSFIDSLKLLLICSKTVVQNVCFLLSHEMTIYVDNVIMLLPLWNHRIFWALKPKSYFSLLS